MFSKNKRWPAEAPVSQWSLMYMFHLSNVEASVETVNPSDQETSLELCTLSQKN